MKERPILMTPENAQKCFDGVKTQTRRIVNDINPTFLQGNPTGEQIHNAMRCPYGEVGDRLWIREACWIWGSWRQDEIGRWHFVEGQRKEAVFDRSSGFSPLRKGDAGFGFVRRPGIFMPRWACRTVVEITNIRVQRVQEISHDDALAEGLAYEITTDVPCSNFRDLWTSINGAESWDANPFVWAITFKKVIP